ncbi:30S ribosomal protein S9 [Candidatus Curtissbacteria bacterium]|nr:30S ribosomal protein S9 [Candidatus Curtissbacteria bacterium]
MKPESKNSSSLSLGVEDLRAGGQKSKTSYISAHGNRKQAVARIRLFKGKGETVVNEKPIETYFPQEVDKIVWQKPFLVTKSQGQYYATIKVSGSGKRSQLDAIALGISRALVMQEESFRPILRKAGLLTRDSRKKERRKYGRAQKARKGKQSPKR